MFFKLIFPVNRFFWPMGGRVNPPPQPICQCVMLRESRVKKKCPIFPALRDKLLQTSKNYLDEAQKIFLRFLSGKTLVVLFEKACGVEFLKYGGALNFWRVVVVDTPPCWHAYDKGT